MDKNFSTKSFIIISSQGWGIKNFLLSNFCNYFEKNTTIYFFSPINKILKESPINNSKVPNVIFNRLIKHRSNWLQKKLEIRRNLYHFVLCETDTMKIKLLRATKYYNSFQNNLNRFSIFLAQLIKSRGLISLIDKAYIFLSKKTLNAKYYYEQFKKIRPELIISSFYIDKNEWIPLIVAKSMKIKTIIAINSWDNLSSKSRVPILPDYFFVWSGHMKQEVLSYYPEFDEENILICGAPQFDFHLNNFLIKNHDAFISKYNLKKNRKTIFYAGVTPGLMPHEDKIVIDILNAIKNNQINGNPNFILRLHPKDGGSRYNYIKKLYPYLNIIIPNEINNGNVENWTPTTHDQNILVDLIKYSDIIINVASTITIDSAIFDKPIINPCYDHIDNSKNSPGLRIYDYTHYANIKKSKGVQIAKSRNEMISFINNYLDNPELDSSGRKKIVKSICGDMKFEASLVMSENIKNMISKEKITKIKQYA